MAPGAITTGGRVLATTNTTKTFILKLQNRFEELSLRTGSRDSEGTAVNGVHRGSPDPSHKAY